MLANSELLATALGAIAKRASQRRGYRKRIFLVRKATR